MSPFPRQLEDLERLGWRFGLEGIRSLLGELQNPQNSLKFIHVAGSNGKGSTCAYMASFLRHCGYKTGLYTSPHLCSLQERFRINGQWIPNGDLRRLTKRVLEACGAVRRRTGRLPTHFEALTALAALWFKEQKADWVVWEVGLGGRLDATNAIESPAVALLTPVGLEHQDILGNTVAQIAAEKAGILKPGSLAATVQVHPGALRTIESIASQRGAKLWVGGRDFHFRKEKGGFRWEGPGLRESFRLPGLPDFQISNASLALAGIQCLRAKGISADVSRIQASFSSMRWPGRLETVRANPLVVMDGAHNPDAFHALASALRTKFSGKKWIVLNGFLRDKDYQVCCGILKPFTELAVVTQPSNERAEEGVKIFRAWEGQGTPAILVKDWKKALRLALDKGGSSKGSPLLITGSLYLLGDCRKELMGLKGLEKI